MRWIVISPHFDDAVLSCGGFIYEHSRRGRPVEIWTICAGDPLPGELSTMAEKIHHEWGTGSAAETVRLRRGEDRQAAAHVGAATRHLEFSDCIYRRAPGGTLLYSADVFTPWNPFEKALPEEITARLEKELRPGDRVICPLAIGGHIDHVMTRRAVENLDRRLFYYADIPYLLERPKSLEMVTAGLEGKTHRVTVEGLEAWLAGIAAYRSQISMLFKTEEQMRQAIRAYWKTRHGIQLWWIGSPARAKQLSSL